MTKTLMLAWMFCLLSAANNLNIFAQCSGVYAKSVTRKILSEKTVFLDNYDLEYYKDFTGDGKIDLIGFVADDQDDPITKINIFPGDGAGDFGTPILITLPTPIYARPDNFKIADFNSDGKYDFITITNQIPQVLTVYQNTGGGNFTPLAPNILANERITGIFDINNDGLADFIVNSSSEFFYRLSNADGSFGARVPFIFAQYEFAADFNADGKKDFPVISIQSGVYSLRIYNNMGNGTFTLSSSSFPIFNTSPTLSAVTDFNNDGNPDLLYYVIDESSVALIKVIVMMNLGNGNFAKTELNTSGKRVNSRAIPKDFNGDGFQDIYIKTFLGDISAEISGYSIYINNGTGSFTRSDYNGRDTGYPVGDLDGDNKADFLRVNSNDGVVPYPQMFNQTLLLVSKNVCNRVGQTRIVDFDGDGWNDIVYWRPSDGRWRVAGRKFPYPTSTFYWGQTGDVPVPGDYDGDGKTDYAVFRPSNGAWYYVNSSNNSFSGVAFGAIEDKPVPADYNGDGKTDVAVFRPSNGVWYVLYSGTNQFYGAAFGASEDKPVPEDYDGDGKIDFAVFRPSNGFWYVLKSSDTTFFAVAWGLDTDTRVPADYDGDGKADIAVVRPGATNTWYIRRSNGAPSISYPFGTASDIIQPSDWNGDEIWDTGIFRQNNGNWYSSFYPLGFATFGQTTGEVPISSLNVRY